MSKLGYFIDNMIFFTEWPKFTSGEDKVKIELLGNEAVSWWDLAVELKYNVGGAMIVRDENYNAVPML